MQHPLISTERLAKASIDFGLNLFWEHCNVDQVPVRNRDLLGQGESTAKLLGQGKSTVQSYTLPLYEEYYMHLFQLTYQCIFSFLPCAPAIREACMKEA